MEDAIAPRSCMQRTVQVLQLKKHGREFEKVVIPLFRSPHHLELVDIADTKGCFSIAPVFPHLVYHHPGCRSSIRQ